MNSSQQNPSYEIKRLNYLLENKLGEIKAYKEELKALKQINSLCASFIHYLASKEAVSSEKLEVKIPKEEISKYALEYSAHCSSDNDFYILTFSKRDSDEEN